MNTDLEKPLYDDEHHYADYMAERRAKRVLEVAKILGQGKYSIHHLGLAVQIVNDSQLIK